ncbi:hypothetical protein SETIT_5G284200v2 [Setaria italica]|uniref:Uncharacterized protein n=1 Tax=Setaria italica TaxID=4555 RepID=A0A368RBF8_SETIT|nr:hypothetical protein SETIT_5G284200v2 [Setaria italica]
MRRAGLSLPVSVANLVPPSSRHASRATGASPANGTSSVSSSSSLRTPPPTAKPPAGTAATPDTLLGALLATWTSLCCSPSTSIQPSSQSQSGNAEAEHASDLILSAASSGISSASSSDSDSQNAASSVLLGDTHRAFSSAPANATNGCSRSSAAVHRSAASLAKQQARKSLASADSQDGTSGTASVYPIRWSAARTSSMSLHGARPVAISMTVHPSAQTSAAGPCSSPRATSGAMNAGVPPIARAEPGALALPKSASLARPSAPITTFRALTSPCTTERAWRYASPRATSAAYARTARSPRDPPFRATSSASDPPGAYSRKSWYDPSAPSAPPTQRTTWGEDRPASTPRSRLSAAAAWAAAADLTANSSPDAPSAARDTTAPDAPRPSVWSLLQFPLTAPAAMPSSWFLFFLSSVVGCSLDALRCCGGLFVWCLS